jgi:hypothetical protein
MLAKSIIALALVITSCPGETLAAPVTVTVGDTAIMIPEPRELVALRKQDSPYYRFGAAMQANQKNRLLAAFLPPANANEAERGGMPTADDWAIAFALGPQGDQPVTRTQFQRELVPFLDAQFDKAMASKDLTKKVDKAAAQATERFLSDSGADPGAVKLKMGVISPLGVYARKDNYYVHGAGTRISVTTREGVTEMPIVMMIAFVHVRSRLFAVAVYRKLGSRADIDAAKGRALAWAEAITKANP